jgi:hypothetical protein
MGYVLDGTPIRAPHQFSESNSTQSAQNRTLDGSVSRDYFGNNKRIWQLEYRNTKKTDYDTVKAIYDSYLSTTTAKTWSTTETNYAVASTTVHVDLQERGFSIHGTDYLSDFTLILTEA